MSVFTVNLLLHEMVQCDLVFTKISPLPTPLVEGARQCHHLTGGPAGHWYAEHGGDLTAQHAGELPALLLRGRKAEHICLIWRPSRATDS